MFFFQMIKSATLSRSMFCNVPLNLGNRHGGSQSVTYIYWPNCNYWYMFCLIVSYMLWTPPDFSISTSEIVNYMIWIDLTSTWENVTLELGSPQLSDLVNYIFLPPTYKWEITSIPLTLGGRIHSASYRHNPGIHEDYGVSCRDHSDTSRRPWHSGCV
jgi:hypothetical protein